MSVRAAALSTKLSQHPRAQAGLAIAGVTLFTGLVSQRWAGLDTPDSSFYASLGLFGDEVTDRSPFPSYYWTRLGVIAPVRALTEVFGTWPGFAIYRMLLLLLIVACSYLILRRYTSALSATFLVAITSLSTVVLSYLGNPYLTGSVLAGTVVLIACAMANTKASSVIAGIALGWLVMVNPPGVLLAGTIWLVLRIQARPKLRRFIVNDIAISGASAIATFVIFLGIGRLLFPKLNWFSTYLEANSRLNYSDFASKNAVWLGDISLIVPVAVLVIVLVAWVTHRDEIAAQRALVISTVSIAFMLVFSPMMGGIVLEAPMYQAMLWPPAMVALGLVLTFALPDQGWNRWQGAVGIIAIALVFIAGHLTPNLNLAAGWLLAAVCIAVFLFASYKRTIGALLGLALVLSGAQLLQNSRGPIGLYYLSPYNYAFNANPISEKLHTAVTTQEWLLANTTREDTILDWVQGDWVGGDRELYVVAAMQLWGENRVTLEPTLSDVDIERLESIRPTALALYGQTMEGVMAFWSSIPAANQPTAPKCYDFTWPNAQIPQGLACLTKLSWGI
ncbi:MAG: hypothetical protein ACOYN7_07455 [Candidatus Nanopelagicales bacterium]